MQRTPNVSKTGAKILVVNMHRLLYRAEVVWLSTGKMLSRFYGLRGEIAAFFAQDNSPLADLFSNSVGLAHVAYLADVFEQLNTLCLCRGRRHIIFEQCYKIDTFKIKISVWACHVSKKRLDMFPIACHEGQQLDMAGKKMMRKMITTHLNKLLERVNDYFPEKQRDEWIRDPFEIDMESVRLPSNAESQLVGLSCDHTLKKKFMEVSLSHFWCDERVSFPCHSSSTNPPTVQRYLSL